MSILAPLLEIVWNAYSIGAMVFAGCFVTFLIGLLVWTEISKAKWKAIAKRYGLKFKMPDRKTKSYMSMQGSIKDVPVQVVTYGVESQLLNLMGAAAGAVAVSQGRYGGTTSAKILHIEIRVPFPSSIPSAVALRKNPEFFSFTWSTKEHDGYSYADGNLRWRSRWKGGNPDKLEEAMNRLVSLHKRLGNAV